MSRVTRKKPVNCYPRTKPFGGTWKRLYYVCQALRFNAHLLQKFTKANYPVFAGKNNPGIGLNITQHVFYFFRKRNTFGTNHRKIKHTRPFGLQEAF
jgi:hypothetical protein